MKTLSEILLEKLVINKETKSSNSTLDDLIFYFEIEKLMDNDDPLYKKPYITKEDFEEIKSKLEDFIERNNCNKETSKYYTNRGRKFDNNKISKKYIKDNAKWIGLNSFLKDEDTFFKKNSLYFKSNDSKKLIAMCGPYGGIKICKYE